MDMERNSPIIWQKKKDVIEILITISYLIKLSRFSDVFYKKSKNSRIILYFLI